MISDFCNGRETVKALFLSEKFFSDFCVFQKKRFKVEQSEIRVVTLIRIISSCLNFLPQLLLCVVGIFFVQNEYLTIGSFITLFYLTNNISDFINDIPTLMPLMRNFGVACSRMNLLLNIPCEKRGGVPVQNTETKKELIRFENVDFFYKENQQILYNVNFSLNRGEIIFLVGESGSGKSTVLKLCAGLYPCDEGEIYFEGININQWDLQRVRNEMAYVTQSTYLYPDTIKNNITAFEKRYSENALEQAINAAQISKLVKERGLEYKLGENTQKLSGGQSQRISLARAFYKKPALFLLDEAISAQDPENEEKIIREILRQRDIYNCAVLFVTHRLKYAKVADRILLFENGKIIANGTHEELLETSKE